MLNTDFVSRRYFLRIAVSAVFWIIHGSLHAKSSAQEVKISCNVPSVRLHEDTFLTCFLPEDVGQTKKDFTVYKYSDSETPDAVLDCWWLSGILDCFVATGYRYDKQVSNKLSLEIPRVSSSHVGTYACQVASYPPDLINLCDLNIFSEGRSLCEIPSVKINSQTALTCYFPQDLRKSRTDFSVSHHSTPGDTETVLTCQWKADFLSCSVLSGYVFDNKVTSHLTLSIPKARKDHEGTYSCQTEGAVSLPFKNCSFSLKKETMSTCSAASVHEMESATLRCDFSADISLTRQNVHVIHFDGRENKSTNVLNCTWEKDQPFCLTAPGFEFNNTVTDHLVITIPRVTPDHNGTYVCDLQGVQFENFELCNFVVISGIKIYIYDIE
ncbi:uncharacterized protein LOC112575700 [Pomacea canaliculata]|uniref:uncharacterized protein LOC112575700 n=1 Tax=Pomacea canaliculata TaxID=400727 RepID=UPI000D727789|nr:uncharacterized protein LOC112575700 [Pomacea canaliculata]